MVLLESIKQIKDAAILTEKILATISEPYEFAKATLHIVPSIGVAVYPEDGEDGNELIQYADNAMYQVKRERHRPVHQS